MKEQIKNDNLNEIEDMLVKKIAWYMDDAIDFKEKKESTASAFLPAS